MELLSHRKHWMVTAAATAVLLWIASSQAAGAPAEKPGSAAGEAGAKSEPAPSLELKVDGPAKTLVDSTVSFELTVSNAGKTPATGLLVIDRFDPGLEHAVGQSPIERTLADLAPGKSLRIGLTFRVTRPGRLTHTVEVTSGGKAVASVRCSLTAAETTKEPVEPAKGTKKREPPEAKPESLKPAPGSEFPEIEPKDQPGESEQEKLPDLGPPLVEKPDDLKQLGPNPVWIDRNRKQVVVVGAVCARECPLELFACLRASKEHESIVAVPTKASFIHAALLAVGAEPGSPVQFQPTYVPAKGTEIEITVAWKDAKGNRRTARAQEWVRDAKTKKAMEHPWVFAGSRLWKHPHTGQMLYQADRDGDLICVSNFPSAMLDLPIESTSSDAELVFECFTERIPPRGTPVTLILTPKPAREPKKESKPAPAAKEPAKTPGPGDPARPEKKPTRPPVDA